MKLHCKWVVVAAAMAVIGVALFVLVGGNARATRPSPRESGELAATSWPRLSWAPFKNAQEYQVEIRDPADSQFVFGVWGESVVLRDPLPSGVSRWRVRAGIENEWTQWSPWTEIAQTVELPEEPYTILLDGPGDQDMPGICRAADGGYLLVFREAEGAIGGEDIAAVRVSPAGNVVWQYLYGGEDDDRLGRAGNTVQPLRDGTGYLVAGVSRSFSRSGAYNPWIAARRT